MINYTFIDLFAGIGGMRLAYENNNCKCVFSSEFDKFAQKTYETNFGEKPSGDITKIDAKDIPDHDILVGGFPCQPFSSIGVLARRQTNRPIGFEDKEKGTLFFEICRILREKRPKAFMLENVKNLLYINKKETFKTILEMLNELDYEVFYDLLDGQLYVPQHRERVLIIGFDRQRYGKDIKFEFKLNPVEPKPKVRDILETNVDEKYTVSDTIYKSFLKTKGRFKDYAKLDGISRTLCTSSNFDILVPQIDKNPRKYTPRECARLQGFPDSFIIPVSDTQARRQFGNSVVVPLMTDVAKCVINTLKELDKNT